MGAMSEDPAPSSVPSVLCTPRVKLLAEQGPSAIKARDGGGRGRHVDDGRLQPLRRHPGADQRRGRPRLLPRSRSLRRRAEITDDPVTDLFAMALITRELARANPHLYDLMFGLSTRATYRPTHGQGRTPQWPLPRLPGSIRTRHRRLHPARRNRTVSRSMTLMPWPAPCGASCTATSPWSWPTTSPSSTTRWCR